MLELPPKFKSALGNGIRTSLFPVVRFYKDVRLDEPDTWNEAESVNLSIKDTNLDGIAFDPLLINAPSVKSSADVINNKYTISSVSLSISNASYNGKIFSDGIQSLLNAVCQVYYCANGLDSLDDCLLVYTGTVRRFNQSAESIKLQLEDITEQMLTTKIPSSLVPDDIDEPYREKDKNKPYPMVYGYVDKSPLIPRSSGFNDMGELENQITQFDIDKKGRELAGPWGFPEKDNYGSNIITESHDLVQNGWLPLGSYLSVYSNNFTPILQDIPDNWGDEDLSAPDANVYNFQQSNGTNTSASIEINSDAVIVSKDINGIPTRAFRPIKEVECFTYCDNNQGDDVDAINRIYGFTNYFDENMWLPWEFDQNVTGRLGYEKDWGDAGTATWWEPTACNLNVNGGVFSSIDNRWLQEGRSPAFPVNRLQDGDKTSGIYLGGRNPDGVRGEHNKSGGAYIRMIFEENIGSFPCVSKIVYDAEYHSFNGMEAGFGNKKQPYPASFWTNNVLPVSLELPSSTASEANDLLVQFDNEEVNFPAIPTNDHGWEHWVDDYDDSQSGTQQTIRKFNGSGISETFNTTNAFNSVQFGIPQYPIRGNIHGNDKGYVATQLFNCYMLQDVVVDNPVEKDFYGDIAGRMSDDEVIVSPDKIMEDILKSELNYNGNIELSENNDWQNSFTLNEQKEAKEIFEGLFKSSLVIPSFDSEGQFKFINLDQIIETTEDLPVINNEDVIKYSFELSKIDDIYNQVIVRYNKNYASGEFDSETGYSFCDEWGDDDDYPTYDEVTQTIYPDEPEKQYSIDYYGLKSEETKLEVESEYIRDEAIARKLQRRLACWYANQHLITKIDLPVSYIDLEAGDYIKFDELLGGKLAFGQDYTIHTNKNGQLIYPAFFITKVSKSLQKVSIEAIQVHRGEYGFPDNWEDGTDYGEIAGNGNWNLDTLFDESKYVDNIIDEEVTEENYFNVFWASGNILPLNNVNAIIDTDYLDYWMCNVWYINTSESFSIELPEGGELIIEPREDDYEVGEQLANPLISKSVSTDQGYGSVTLQNKYTLPDEFMGRVDYIFKASIIGYPEITMEIPFYHIGSQGLLGDVNGDGGINILDVVRAVQFILNPHDFPDFPFEKADMDNNGAVNVLDVIALINIILGQE